MDVILQAAAEVIADRGWAAATTNRFAQRAGVSIGSLYQYFPNKEAILAALMQRHLEQVQPIVDEALEAFENEDLPLEVAFQQLFERLIEMHGREPTLNRILAEQDPLPTVVEQRHAQGEATTAERIASILRRRKDTRSDDALEVAYVLAQATEALSRWLVHHAPPSLDKDAYVRASARMLAGLVS